MATSSVQMYSAFLIGQMHADLCARSLILGCPGAVKALTSSFTSSPGTALFAAPELLSRGIGGFESDIYAFGMVAWHLVSSGSSEADLHDYQVRYQVCERGWRPAFPTETPGAFKDLVSCCWCEESSGRPSFTALRKPLTALLVETQRSLGIKHSGLPAGLHASIRYERILEY